MPNTFKKHRKTEQAEHDGGHGGQVVDVDLDDLRQAVLWGELFQIDGGGNAEREGQAQGHDHGEERADHCAPDAGKFRLAAGAGGEEHRVEGAFDAVLVSELIEIDQRAVIELAVALRQVISRIDHSSPAASLRLCSGMITSPSMPSR
jgi:hypothetical protein